MTWILYVMLGAAVGFGLCAILTAGKLSDADAKWILRLDKQQDAHEAQELALSTFWRGEVDRLTAHNERLAAQLLGVVTPDPTPARQSKSTDDADDAWVLTHAGIEREAVDG